MNQDDIFGINISDFCKTYGRSETTDDFSLCFEDTVLSWSVCLASIVFGVFYMIFASKSHYTYGWLRPLFLLSLVSGIGSLIPQFLVMKMSVDIDIPVLTWNGAAITLSTVFAMLVMCYERAIGNISTFPVWTHWTLMTIYSAVKIRTLAQRAWNETAELDSLLPVLFCVYGGLVLANVIIHSFKEAPDQLLHMPKEEIQLEEKSKKMKYDRLPNDTRRPCPMEYVSFLDYITYHWLTKLVWRGFRRPLTEDDLYHVPKEVETETIITGFYKAWLGKKPCPKGTTSCKGRGLLKSIMSFNKRSLLGCVFFKLLNDLLMFVPPIILKKLIEYNMDHSPSGPSQLSDSYGLTWCVILLLSLVLQTVCVQAFFDRAFLVGARARVAMVASIYRKALLLSNAGQKSSQLGQMINLMQVDAQKFEQLFVAINDCWSCPLQIILAMVMLYGELQASTFVGISVTLLMLPLNGVLMGKFQMYQRQIMAITDQRVRKTNEVLDGIKVIKLYGWEENFLNQVEKIRSTELKAMKYRIRYSVMISFIWQCSPTLVTLFTFLCYSLLGNNLTSSKAYVALALFNILRFPLIMLPNMMTQMIQARVSLSRISSFMALPELDMEAISHGKSSEPEAVVVEGGKFSWDAEDTDNLVTLDSINVTIPRGKLVAIVGAVGSGKTSLISAMLGEMEKLEGSVKLNGSVSYVPQVSWILNDTLKNNILFGAEFDKRMYKDVIENCALEADLQILPNGDATEIGEKGINVSGGQKQRISLARAVYNTNDIYIFDDPLSAVDAHVGKHLFDKVIGPDGMCNDKTRILVTHKLTVLPEVDHVIVLKEGKVLEQGTYSDLMACDSELHRIVSSYEPDKDTPEDDDEEELSGDEAQDLPVVADTAGVKQRKGRRRSSACSVKGNDNKADDKLIAEEQVAKGNISIRTYISYFAYMSVFFLFWMVMSFLLAHGALLGSNLWLAVWSDANDAYGKDPSPETKVDLFYYLGIFGLFGVLQACFVMVMVLSIGLASIQASAQMHKALIDRILRLPMCFYDTTPIGRILNRFSKDINTIDEMLPNSLRSFVSILGTILVTAATIGISIPIMCAVFIPICVVYIFVQKVYIPTSRQLKRLESVSRSPIYNQFGETLLGLTSIRAYQKSDTFIKYNEGLTEDNIRSYFMSITSNRWLAFRLEIIGHIVIFCTALISILQVKTINPSQAGLSISMAMGVTAALNWVVRMYSELEINVVSVERVNEYSAVETEKPLECDTPPQKEWPQKGSIEYKGVSVRYREGLDLVLKDLIFTVNDGERIGIVGRTGAGKSSITLTLFRILELAEGAIIIDGVDISQIGLHELRKKLSIIPQDPILFASTIRQNLDPFQAYTDEELWAALESASLKPFFEQQDKKLDFMVQEGGSNLSVGQRQLVCLGRALLSDNRIIVMDEATAAVDIETDSIIQDAIRQTFAGRTILTIAHRLNTILDYDRILVLDKGEIAEYGSATELKRNQGIFHSMLNDAGLLLAVPDELDTSEIKPEI